MDLSTQSILIILVVGLVAGWLAGQIVVGGGMGIIADIALGIVGAFIGSWVLPKIGLVLGPGLLAAAGNSLVGLGDAEIEGHSLLGELVTDSTPVAGDRPLQVVAHCQPTGDV